MLTLVGRARRRLFYNELFIQAANAAAAVLIALILLLFVGTELLDWRWLLVVSAVAAGTALYRARKHLLSFYEAAQVVDQRLALADTISTAIYFQQDSSPHRPASLRQFQMERASHVSESVDVRAAVPYAMPRGVYLLAVLLLVAGSLFGLRYGLLGRLDLQAPLARMLGKQFGLSDRTEEARNMKKRPPQVPAQDDASASPNDPDQTQTMQPDTSTNDGSDASDNSKAEKGNSSKSEAKKDGNAKSDADGDQEAQAESNPSQSGDKSGQDGKQDQKQQQAGKPEGNNNSGENSSLMNKAKDMLQNLLSSLKPPQSNPANQQQNKDSNNQQGKGQPKQQNDKNGQPQNSGQKGDQSEGQQGEQGQDQQDQKEQGNGKNDSQQGNKQPGSGAGNQDGDKRIKQAEDVAAMGKITEILGKRSATVTGEATVEVQATSQQLKTAYTQGAAQHGQSGGETNRDEIPAAIQPYVQEYFKQARKTPPSPAKKQ